MRGLAKSLILLSCLLASNATRAEEPPRKPLPLGRVEVSVKDLHCATCARKAARKLYAVKGVRQVKASVKKDLLVITVPADQPVPTVAIWVAVAAAEVEPTELRWIDQKHDAESIKPLIAARSDQRVAR